MSNDASGRNKHVGTIVISFTLLLVISLSHSLTLTLQKLIVKNV